MVFSFLIFCICGKGEKIPLLCVCGEEGHGLQFREAETIDQCVDFFASLAHGALVCAVAGVIRQVVGVEDRADGVTGTGIYGGEDGRDTGDHAAVISNGFDGGLGSIAGGDRRGQNQDALALDHRDGIIAEEQLATCGMFRRDYVDRLMRIHITEVFLRPRDRWCRDS